MRLKENFFVIVTLVTAAASTVVGSRNEHFTESLTLRPLSDGKLLTHFEFTTKVPGGAEEGARFAHYNLFPRALGQIIQTHQARELHLTFTQGRWDYEGWGYPIMPTAGTGVELWAWLWKNGRIDENWKSLTNSLAGLFCASLNYMDDTITVQPRLSFRPKGPYNMKELERVELRYGSLPHENVCTENLTPWKKLLPCKSKAGLALLLNSHRLYDSNFHSMGIHVQPVCLDNGCTNMELELKQTLSTVLDPVRKTDKRDWTLDMLFERPLTHTCPVAVESMIFLTIPGNNTKIDPEPHGVVGRTAVYDIKQVTTTQPFTIAMAWQEEQSAFDVNLKMPHIVAHRYFTGYGQERGGIKVDIYNRHHTPALITYYDVIPWYLKLYLHTLRVEINGRAVGTRDLLHRLFYQPAVDRSRPAVIEAQMTLPPDSMTTLLIEFDKVFLKYTEYPPDANRGFDIGSVVVTTMPRNDSRVTNERPLMRIYTEALLVSLPTPDFSMPYNVIMLTCTVIALFFGSMFNLLTRQFVVVPSENLVSKGLLQEKLDVQHHEVLEQANH